MISSSFNLHYLLIFLLIYFILLSPSGNFKCLKNGPMFLSDTESDSDDHDDMEVPRRNKMPSVREPQSLKKSLGYNGPPPPYTVERTNGPSIISLDVKARRAMQNL